MAIPLDIAARFDDAVDASTAAGPCLIEPAPDSLFPKNWLRPRFRWPPLEPGAIVEIRLRVAVERNELVVYTNGTSWEMSRPIWDVLSRTAVGYPISVTARSLAPSAAAPTLATTSSFTIAPVSAPGTIVYWSINAETGATSLNGFQIGQENVTTIVRPPVDRCLGCHSNTPDGEFVAYSDADTPDGQYAFVALRSTRDGASEPAFLTDAARTLLQRRNQHLPTFSPAYWQPGNHVALSLYNLQLIWTDLEAPSQDPGVGWGRIALDGDPGTVPAWPAWSHDGSFIVYSSGEGTIWGGVLTDGDIYHVPYNEGLGGTAMPIAGASDPAYNEFYPTLSPDDELVAFSRVRAEDGDSYNNPQSELFVVPVTGGDAVRLISNDPGACQTSTSPGVTNSWPKWAPDATVTGGRTYYWLTFSSTRGGGVPQLYVAPVVREGPQSLVTHPALYLWNQPPSEGNHTPAWDSLPASVQ